MKYILVIFLMTVVAGAGWLMFKNKSEVQRMIENVKEGRPALAAENPYTIEAMKKRKYKTQVNVEKEIRKTNRFTSFKVSFDSDGLKEYALMNVPSGQPPVSGWPVVIVNHGHIPPDQYSTENSYINTSAYFANAGFLVLKPDYRGHDKSEGEAEGVIARIEYAVDVLNLMAGIPHLQNANADRIYMYGHSMGGDVTLRVLEASTQVKAATLWAPAVQTFPEGFLYFARKNTTSTGRVERFAAEIAQNFPEGIFAKVDTLANVDKVSVPVNVQHSITDESVPYKWGETLARKLKDQGKIVNFYSYPNDNHDIAGNWSTALNRDIELFKNN